MRTIDICEGLGVSRLVLGTASLHHIPTSARRVAFIEAAVERGISHVDTAPYYGDGIAELDVGRVRKVREGRVSVATKIGLYPPHYSHPFVPEVWLRRVVGRFAPFASRPVVDFSLVSARKSLDRSLRRLNRGWVDILFVHEPALHPDDLHRLIDWLREEKFGGRIRAWGLAGTPARLLETLPLPGDAVLQSAWDAVEMPQLAGAVRLVYGVFRSSSSAGSSANERLHTLWQRSPGVAVITGTRTLSHLEESVKLEQGSP
ncbi:MAG: aldo/keto reductase [Thermoanaerobaculia bacterium]